MRRYGLGHGGRADLSGDLPLRELPGRRTSIRAGDGREGHWTRWRRRLRCVSQRSCFPSARERQPDGPPSDRRFTDAASGRDLLQFTDFPRLRARPLALTIPLELCQPDACTERSNLHGKVLSQADRRLGRDGVPAAEIDVLKAFAISPPKAEREATTNPGLSKLPKHGYQACDFDH